MVSERDKQEEEQVWGMWRGLWEGGTRTTLT